MLNSQLLYPEENEIDSYESSDPVMEAIEKIISESYAHAYDSGEHCPSIDTIINIFDTFAILEIELFETWKDERGLEDNFIDLFISGLGEMDADAIESVLKELNYTFVNWEGTVINRAQLTFFLLIREGTIYE